MRISLIQMNSTDDKAKNLEKAQGFIDEAANAGSEIISLPETFSWLGPDSEKSRIAEPAEGETVSMLSEAAKKHNVIIHGGSIFESAMDEGKCSNTSFFFGKDGEISAVYRKIHLFDAVINGKEYLESEYVVPGKDIVVCEADFAVFGFSICYDLRFPELYRDLSENDAQIVFVPAAFTIPTGKAHWEVLLRARAIENQVFIIAPAQVGTDSSGKEYYGHSMIIDPWGTILARADGTSEGVISAEIDLEFLEETRNKLPSLKHRKLP